MPKRTARSRKRVHRRHRSQSSPVAALFTFPKFILYAFIALSLVFLYQISLPPTDVKGANTTSYDIISDSQYETAKNTSSVANYPRYVYLRIWKDDGDAKKEGDEKTCPERNYTITVNGSDKTIKQKPDCKQTKIDVHECNKIVFSAQLKNYTLSGIEYTDKSGIRHSLKGKSKISFCGGQYFEGGWSRDISFGLRSK